MYHFVKEMCTYVMCTCLIQNGALWDIGLVHCRLWDWCIVGFWIWSIPYTWKDWDGNAPGNMGKFTTAWWRHQMETFSALLAICAGNSPVPVNFPHKGQWRAALMFALICVWISAWINNRKAGDLRRYCAHYDVIVMDLTRPWCLSTC